MSNTAKIIAVILLIIVVYYLYNRMQTPIPAAPGAGASLANNAGAADYQDTSYTETPSGSGTSTTGTAYGSAGTGGVGTSTSIPPITTVIPPASNPPLKFTLGGVKSGNTGVFYNTGLASMSQAPPSSGAGTTGNPTGLVIHSTAK